MSSILFGDYETRSAVDLKKCGADVYARHPSTQVMAFGYAFGSEKPEMVEIGERPPQRVLDHIGEGGTFVAHNAPFERLIWNYVWKRDFPEIPPLKISQMVCTMARAYAMGLPGSLEKAAIALGLDDKKDLKSGRIMLQLSQPREILDGEALFWDPVEFEDKYDRMYAYCAQDIEVERQIYFRTLPLSKSEQEMWEIDHNINQRGVRVDISSALEAINVVAFEAQRLNEEIREVTGNAVATTSSNAQLTAWLNNQGVKTEGVAKSDVSDLLEEKDLHCNVRRALEIRKEAAKSSTSKFQALIHRTNQDQRMRSTLQYHGAGTGRWAGRGFQVHNLPRPRLSEVEIEGVFNALSF